MKYIIILVILHISLIAQPPHWYMYQGIPSKDYEIIGYGEGNTLAEAKQVAKNDIAKSIQTQLSSSMSIKKSFVNGNYNNDIKQNINEQTNVLLSGLEIIESNYIDYKYYVALKYINLPFAKKVKVLMKDTKQIEKSSNTYLNKTPLLNELKKEFGFYPTIEISDSSIVINDKSFHLSKKEFIKLFANIENDFLKVDIRDNLKNEDFYFINIVLNKTGYLNIFQVYESGETTLLLANKNVKENDKVVFPNPNEYQGLEAIIPKGQNITRDLTIVALCNKKKDLSLFDTIDNRNNKKSLLFNTLLLKIRGCEQYTKTIKVKRR